MFPSKIRPLEERSASTLCHGLYPQLARHNSWPPTRFLAASWISTTESSLSLRNITSPSWTGLVIPTGLPETRSWISRAFRFTRRDGLLTKLIRLNTGLNSWYFRPSHRRRDDTLSKVVGTKVWSGPWRSPRWTELRNPSL